MSIGKSIGMAIITSKKGRAYATVCLRMMCLTCSMFFTIGCAEPTQKNPNANDPYANAPLHTSFNVSVTFQDGSRIRATLTAGVAVVDEVRQITTLSNGVHVVFYDKTTGMQAAMMDADSAHIDDRTKDMTAIGNVHVKSDSSHTTLDTPRLVWVQKEEKIRTTERVHIVTPTEVIDGVGLISDQMLTDYRVFNVQGVHHP